MNSTRTALMKWCAQAFIHAFQLKLLRIYLVGTVAVGPMVSKTQTLKRCPEAQSKRYLNYSNVCA